MTKKKKSTQNDIYNSDDIDTQISDVENINNNDDDVIIEFDSNINNDEIASEKTTINNELYIDNSINIVSHACRRKLLRLGK